MRISGMTAISVCFTTLTACPVAAIAECIVSDSTGAPIQALEDPLGQILQGSEACPEDVMSLRQSIESTGATIASTMVANRGFHNPGRGSFSVFETVSGEIGGRPVADHQFFFGHFTRPDGNNLVLAQSGGLMVEAIGWDLSKGLYNFYELIGSQSGARTWVYRGDSADILADVANLHLADQGESHFGARLRCSGCHVGGGPIMKELEPPHSDWWTTATGLPLGGRSPAGELAEIVPELRDASFLSENVKRGIETLHQSEAWKSDMADQSLRAKLRPLFCATEINLAPAVVNAESGTELLVLPDTFFVDPFWETSSSVAIDSGDYANALADKGSQFPETNRIDGQHPFLTPVRSYGDGEQIAMLIADGVIDAEFAADVLAVDFTNPLFSEQRCSLLRLLPEDGTETWPEQFLSALKSAATPASISLTENIEISESDLDFHRGNAEALLAACSLAANDDTWVASLIDLLAQRRSEVIASAISTSQSGQILEPGFRVIFPQWSSQPAPGTFRASDECQIGFAEN